MCFQLTQEAVERRRERAERFNLPDAAAALQYKPDDEIAAKDERAQKFGLKDYAPEKAVMMDMGEDYDYQLS